MNPKSKDWTIAKLADGTRIIFLRGTVVPMTAEEVSAALAPLVDTNPVWRAINQLLDEGIASAAADMSSPTLPGETTRHAAGGFTALSELKEQLWRFSGKIRRPGV